MLTLDIVLLDTLVGAILLPFCLINSLPEKISMQLKISMYSLSVIVSLLISYFAKFQLLYLMSPYIILSAGILLLALFTKNKILNILSGILGYIVTIVMNNIVLLLLDILFGLTVEKFMQSLPMVLTFYIAYFILTFFVTRILSSVIKRLDFDSLKKYKVSWLILANLIICVTILVFNISYGMSVNFPSETIYFNCILFFLYFVLSIMLISRILKTTKKAILAEEKEKQYKELESYVKTIDESNQEIRKFKHDYLNILSTLDIMIKERKIEELKKYFEENILTTQAQLKKNNELLLPLTRISDLPIRSLLISKFNLAISKNIKVAISIEESIEFSLVKPIEIARILGILLDNAIEASVECENPEISLAYSKNNGSLVLAVSNTFKPNTDFSLNNITKEGFSTKGAGRGMGLNILQEILNNYDNVLTNMSAKDSIFTYTITLKE